MAAVSSGGLAASAGHGSEGLGFTASSRIACTILLLLGDWENGSLSWPVSNPAIA